MNKNYKLLIFIFFSILLILFWKIISSKYTFYPKLERTSSNSSSKYVNKKIASERIQKFMNQNLHKKYRPSNFPELKKGPVNFASSYLQPFYIKFEVNNQTIHIADFETMIAIVIVKPVTQLSDLNDERIYKFLSTYFILPNTLPSLKKRESIHNGLTFEMYWENADRTREVRSLRKLMTSGNFIFVACHLFPENIGYSNKSCFEDLKYY